MRDRYRRTTMGLAALSLLLLLACGEETTQPQPAGPEIRYTYERPAGLGERPREVALVVPRVDPQEAAAAGEDKARRLAAALGVRLDPERTERRVDREGEILRLWDDRYRLKVYVPSGMVTFRDTATHNRTPEEQADLPPLSERAALERAREILHKLAATGLVEEEQLLVEAAHFSFRKEQGFRGAEEGEVGPPEIPAAEIADTRVFIPRAIRGLGVSGHGVRITFTKRGEVTGLDLLWRDVDLEARALSVALSIDEVTQRFERSLELPADARVEVIARELVYFDPSKRDPVAYLEPAYLFVYQSLVPMPDEEDEYRVSKVLHHLVPAVVHGRQQLPSPRLARLERLQRTLDTTRPEKVTPVEGAGEEDDE